MAKEELFHPLWGWLLRRLGAFPISRSRMDRNALKVASRMLRSGWALGIFPEGTRGKGGELERTFAGAAFVAFHSSSLILPVGIRGIKEIRPFHRPPVRVNIGLPFTVDGKLTHLKLIYLNEKLKVKITELLNERS
jgi:1-acyl-sn-glycerol-3-phosphate acyltransferase